MSNALLIFQGILGIFFFVALPYSLSQNRQRIENMLIVRGLCIQIALAVILTQFSVVRDQFHYLTQGVDALRHATQVGTQFVFGYLGGGDVPFQSTGNTFIFVFQALPMILVISALSMLLFYLKILPWIVRKMSYFWERAMRIGGALGTAASAKVFLGNLDAPLLIRPYLKDFSTSELFSIMACGMATTSSAVMALYAIILSDVIPNAIGHILTSSVISVPAAITLSRILIPQGSTPLTSGSLVVPYKFSNWMDAVSKGTSDGLHIFLNVAAMLIVVLAIVALGNSVLNLLPDVYGAPLTFQRILGYLFAPITWLMGIPWSEALTAGQLLGSKTVLNEVVAFLDLAALPKDSLSPHSNLIMMYALCGFANFSAIGIVIGGMGAMVPERRLDIVNLSFRSLFVGTCATCLSATIIGVLTRIYS